MASKRQRGWSVVKINPRLLVEIKLPLKHGRHSNLFRRAKEIVGGRTDEQLGCSLKKKRRKELSRKKTD